MNYKDHDVRDPLLGTRSYNPIRPELHHFWLLSYQIPVRMGNSRLTSICHFPRYYRRRLHFPLLLIHPNFLFFSRLFRVESSLSPLVSFVQERGDDKEYDNTDNGANDDSC
jgi:hypothetical protein